MTYRLNELQFTLPSDDVQDASINILKFAALGTSLIVSRSLLGDGETLQSNFDGQLAKLEKQVQDLRYQPAQVVRVGAAQDVDAIEVHNQFSKGAERIYQYQLALVVPGTQQMLALSYVKAQPLGDAENVHWATIKNTLLLNPKP
ncbi:DcrB-related protein [Pseudomonas lurida]|jgi:hypothetical protein|uniref:DcrB-related protein n=1 Tax=Pseudomonas lurida TaxID=244566 RepID=A0ABY9FUG5_9PSED|nr:DcrB-related protein [Pseudomonas lurida]VVP89016.1 hypothetical protein PS907_04224 [Pseudomonas fluorescens]AOE82078.1 hypothetical protein A7318_26825 [Pseudomonas lurida]MBC3232606.1 DUF1795 domain-containing protein [Pseudomonas lurida]MBC3238030.1 DUF1795 domain-containing protein [Pseudomonas lurida]MBC3922663.1 DUF1795 domain-containing protein [Pseudomonas lurida]